MCYCVFLCVCRLCFFVFCLRYVCCSFLRVCLKWPGEASGPVIFLWRFWSTYIVFRARDMSHVIRHAIWWRNQWFASNIVWTDGEYLTNLSGNRISVPMLYIIFMYYVLLRAQKSHKNQYYSPIPCRRYVQKISRP